MTAASLPIDSCLPELIDVLRAHGQAVLEAPPGAGKTTRVPLALLDAGLVAGRILMLEPRRLATRASAERMAQTLGETPGRTVGYRMRGATEVSDTTRIEVVTEGILTRMLQSDPELPGVGMILFDEFHERSLNADLGLALALEVRATLRPDLMLLPMSATLDAAPVAALMAGDGPPVPLVRAEGRAFDVEIRYLDTPCRRDARLADSAAALIRQALDETQGGLLAFLPGEREIRDVAARLGALPGCEVRPLYGAMPFAAQRAAIAPLTGTGTGPGRKVVLATAIAETSLTIEDIRVVVDAGQSRRALYDPGSGMSRLVTQVASHAESTQRAGRAGRVAPGRAYRMWTKGEDGARPAYAPPEIAAADLTGLALELALWGSAELAFLTPPPDAALAEARALLTSLGALSEGRITDHGRALAALPLHPRLAHMLRRAGRDAASLAALIAACDPLRGASADLSLRMRAVSGEAVGTADPGALAAIRTEAGRLKRTLPAGPPDLSLGAMAALAYPDRIARRRPGEAPRYLLSGGKGAELRADDPMADAPFLVATDLDGDARSARIRQAARITEAEVRDIFADDIRIETGVAWSRRDNRVLARRQERLGALTLSAAPWPEAPPEAIAAALCEGIRQVGLTLDGAALLFRARVELVRGRHPDLPEMTDAALTDTLEDWLAPHLAGLSTLEQWRRFDVLPALRAMLDWDQAHRLDAAAPAQWTTPLGRRTPIDYAGEAPEITLRLQEMFGTTEHPTVGTTPLRVTLLSPAGRPLQTTTDIPGFWDSSYADVRRDMRGRYPRHPWPENPREADPTLRAKPRNKT